MKFVNFSAALSHTTLKSIKIKINPILPACLALDFRRGQTKCSIEDSFIAKDDKIQEIILKALTVQAYFNKNFYPLIMLSKISLYILGKNSNFII